MELLFEVIFSIIFEGSIQGMKSKKIPVWLRIICTMIVTLIFLFVIGIIGILSIMLWKINHYVLASLFAIIDLIFIIVAIIKFRNLNMKRDVK